MQILKSIALTSMVLLLGLPQLEAREPDSPEERLRARITNLVAQADGDEMRRDRQKACLEFVITPQNKIVVLDVETESEYLEVFIKGKLNYQTLDIKGLQKLTPYTLNVTFVKRS